MNFSDCQIPADAVAFADQFEERESVRNTLSFRIAMAMVMPADKARRQKRLKNRQRDKEKFFAFS